MNRPTRARASRIGLNLKMDYRAGSELRLTSKVDAVEKRLERKLST